MSANPVLWNLSESGVATVTLNRPEVNNAYDAGLINGVLVGDGRTGQAAKSSRRGAERQRQAFPGRRRPEMDQRGAAAIA